MLIFQYTNNFRCFLRFKNKSESIVAVEDQAPFFCFIPLPDDGSVNMKHEAEESGASGLLYASAKYPNPNPALHGASYTINRVSEKCWTCKKCTNSNFVI